MRKKLKIPVETYPLYLNSLNPLCFPIFHAKVINVQIINFCLNKKKIATIDYSYLFFVQRKTGNLFFDYSSLNFFLVNYEFLLSCWMDLSKFQTMWILFYYYSNNYYKKIMILDIIRRPNIIQSLRCVYSLKFCNLIFAIVPLTVYYTESSIITYHPSH